MAGPSPPQFFTPCAHLFLSDRTMLGLRHGDQLVQVVPLELPGDRSVPDANTCYPINFYYKEAGLPLRCSTVPSVGYFVAAGLCFLAGLVILAPWWLGWLTASRAGPSA